MYSGKKDFHISEMDFMSTIITEDEYSVSKMPSGSTETASNTKFKEPKEKMSYMDLDGQLSTLENPPALAKNGSEWKSSRSIGEKSKIIKKDDPSMQEVPSASNPCQTSFNSSTAEAEEEAQAEKAAKSSKIMIKSSLKPSGTKKLSRSVTWADEKGDGTGSGNLCEFSDGENKESHEILGSTDVGDNDEVLRFASAEAVAMALSEAAEAVASGEFDVTDAGI